MQQSMLNKSRADKFLLVFDVPPILKQFSKKFKQSNTTLIPDSVQFSIFGAAVPEVNVPAVENRYAGNTLYLSSHSKNPYPPVTIGFKIDNEYKNYYAIYSWLNLLHDQYDVGGSGTGIGKHKALTEFGLTPHLREACLLYTSPSPRD